MTNQLTKKLQDALTTPIRVPQLTETERLELRALAEPGRPLGKIIAGALDYADHMKDHIVSAPLVEGSEDLKLARQLQLQREAALSFLQWMTVILDTPVQPQQQDTN